MMKAWPQPKTKIRFTFVRDPLDRFVSAYRELECVTSTSFANQLSPQCIIFSAIIARFISTFSESWTVDMYVCIEYHNAFLYDRPINAQPSVVMLML